MKRRDRTPSKLVKSSDLKSSRAARTLPPAAGRGRKRGVPNKTTVVAREAFVAFLDGNSERIGVLFNRVARRNPAKAIELIIKIAEFVIPKLARTEVVGDGSAPSAAAIAMSPLVLAIGNMMSFPDGGPGIPAESLPAADTGGKSSNAAEVPE